MQVVLQANSPVIEAYTTSATDSPVVGRDADEDRMHNTSD